MKNNKILFDQFIKDYEIDLDDFFDVVISKSSIHFLGIRNEEVEKKISGKFKLNETFTESIDDFNRLKLKFLLQDIYILFTFIKKI